MAKLTKFSNKIILVFTLAQQISNNLELDAQV